MKDTVSRVSSVRSKREGKMFSVFLGEEGTVYIHRVKTHALAYSYAIARCLKTERKSYRMLRRVWDGYVCKTREKR